jgi:serine/threonine-protein kinase
VQVPTSFSPDGRRLAFQEFMAQTGDDIWTVALEGVGTDHPKPGKPEPFLRTGADQTNPAFSPDGRWLAYASNESGSTQIYVRPFPGPGGKWQISTEGGTNPMWSPNGREFFYTSSDRRIMVTSYNAQGESFVAQKPAAWCDFQIQARMQPLSPPFASSILDVARDGKRFAVLAPANTEPQKVPTHLNFWFNFFDELSRRTAKGQ